MPPLKLSRFIGFAFAAACASEAAPPAGPPPPPTVTVATLTATDVTPASELTGRVEAVDTVELRARVAGHVVAVHFREGAEVKAGEVLFTIDPRPYRAALARARAEVARARARVELARVEAKRTEKLLAAGAVARAEQDTVASTVAQSEAELAAATANVQLAQLDVGFTQVRAPIAGRVGEALVSPGDFVSAGPGPTPLTTIISIDPVQVYVTSDEQTYLRSGAGAQDSVARVGLANETGFPHEGRVDFVDPRIDPATGTFRLRVVVANPDGKLAPGLYARVQLPERAPVRAILIDDKAVLTDQDRKYVYVVGATGTAERRDIELGRVIDGKRHVTKGLRDGERLVVTGVLKVFPGAKVAVASGAGK